MTDWKIPQHVGFYQGFQQDFPVPRSPGMVPGRTGPKDSECPGTNKSRELASQKSRNFFCRSEDFLDSFFFCKISKKSWLLFHFSSNKNVFAYMVRQTNCKLQVVRFHVHKHLSFMHDQVKLTRKKHDRERMKLFNGPKSFFLEEVVCNLSFQVIGACKFCD